MSELIPGFGGAYLTRTGTATEHPNSRPVTVKAFLTAAADTASAHSILRDYFVGRGYEVAAVEMMPAANSFEQLMTWQRVVASSSSMRTIGRFLVDADERYNMLSVGVSDALAKSTAMILLAKLGIPDTAVRIDIVGQLMQLQSTDSTMRSRFRPVPGGVEVGRLSSDGTTTLCTLGFNVVQGGAVRFVTASHCTIVPWGQDAGSATYAYFRQPSTSGELIGPEYQDPTPHTGGSCYAGYYCRESDAAMISYPVPTISGQLGYFVVPRLAGKTLIYSNTRDAIESTWYYPTVGDWVDKLGRTTGWTNGEVSAVCVDDVRSGTITDPDLVCLGRTYADASQGDSGGPILFSDTHFTPALRYLVGIASFLNTAFPNETFFTLIGGIYDDFGGLGQINP